MENPSGTQVANNVKKNIKYKLELWTWLAEAASVLNCRTGSIPFMYLGLPLVEMVGDSVFGSRWLIVLKHVWRVGIIKMGFYLFSCELWWFGGSEVGGI